MLLLLLLLLQFNSIVTSTVSLPTNAWWQNSAAVSKLNFHGKITMYRGRTAYVALCISAGTLIWIYSLKGYLVAMLFLLEEIPIELPA